MPDREMSGPETQRLADYLEEHAEAQIRTLLVRMAAVMAAFTVVAVALLVAAQIYTLRHVERNSDVVREVAGLTTTNRRWIDALKADQDLQARRFEKLAAQIGELRGLLAAQGQRVSKVETRQGKKR